MSEAQERNPLVTARDHLLHDQIFKAERLHLVITKLSLAFGADRNKVGLGLLPREKVNFIKFWGFISSISLIHCFFSECVPAHQCCKLDPNLLSSLRMNLIRCLKGVSRGRISRFGGHEMKGVNWVVVIGDIEMTPIRWETLGSLLVRKPRGPRSYTYGFLGDPQGATVFAQKSVIFALCWTRVGLNNRRRQNNSRLIDIFCQNVQIFENWRQSFTVHLVGPERNALSFKIKSWRACFWSLSSYVTQKNYWLLFL